MNPLEVSPAPGSASTIRSSTCCGMNEWRLVPVAPSQYEIIHHQSNEPLCPVRDNLAFDKDRRSIVTWIPGPSTMRCFWEIKLHSRGYYLLSSVEYGEYLYAAEWGEYKERVWTWRKQDEPREKHYHWDIVNVNYCVPDGGGGISMFK
ncbi:uncharacterized protein LOC134216572 [Armigeres subalbatus]|uniref:uncharacterized protein LOC134216572 n=1 Tax=Armigeres subalbatus TaxID=124917 RepID=UPI002ED3F884